MSDDSKLFLTDDIEFDGDKPAVEPTSRMLSWARNSALYRVEQRMMTEKQLRDAYMRKAREKFETISPAQIKALGGNAVDRLLSFLHQRPVTDRAKGLSQRKAQCRRASRIHSASDVVCQLRQDYCNVGFRLSPFLREACRHPAAHAHLDDLLRSESTLACRRRYCRESRR